MKNYEEITKDTLKHFINNTSVREIEGKTKDGYSWRLYKTAFDEKNKIDLIFISHTYAYYKSYNFIPEKFEFGGAIDNITGNIIMSSYYLNELINKTNSNINVVSVYSTYNISEDVSNELTKQIKEHWNSIKINAKKQIYFNDEYTKTQRALEKAQKWFIEDNVQEPQDYIFNTKIDTDEDLLLEYYINKEQVLKKLTKDYFSKNEEWIYKTILCYEEACKILPTLLNNEGIKIEKAIKEALKDIDCNMITVKASKETNEGVKTWVGKVPFYNLKVCKNKQWIPMWKTPAPDKKEFNKLFGNNADLYPEDIDEIIFRKKTLYKKREG
jgi:hypothetical protein